MVDTRSGSTSVPCIIECYFPIVSYVPLELKGQDTLVTDNVGYIMYGE